MNHFSELNLCPALQNNLTRHGLIKPTPVQAESIPPALEGKDVVATAQTGTGKTLGFALPILQALANQKNSGIRAIVLSPTRELAIQIDETFNKLAPGTGIKTAVVVGGVNESHQIRALKAGAQVVIATPGRLSDFLQRKLIKLGSVKTVVRRSGSHVGHGLFAFHQGDFGTIAQAATNAVVLRDHRKIGGSPDRILRD
jgi:ATP-dependent RNA helicase RhlE